MPKGRPNSGCRRAERLCVSSYRAGAIRLLPGLEKVADVTGNDSPFYKIKDDMPERASLSDVVKALPLLDGKFAEDWCGIQRMWDACAAEAASLLAIACRLATPAAENKKILMARESTACEEGQSC